MNVLQAFLAAVRCKPLPSRRNRNLRDTAAGAGGTKNGSRKISGLSGTPSSYAGSHSSRKANRPGDTFPSASSLLATTRNSSSDGLGTSPNPVKKISFTGEPVTGVSTTDACHSHRPGSILRKSHHTASSLSKTSVEDDVRMSPKRKLTTDGSATLECISESAGPWAIEQDKAEEDTVLYVTEPSKELEAWGVEQADGNEDNEDEELGWAIEQEKARGRHGFSCD